MDPVKRPIVHTLPLHLYKLLRIDLYLLDILLDIEKTNYWLSYNNKRSAADFA